MLDKSKIYAGYTKPYQGVNQSPAHRFRRIRILYEDDISYYIASLTENDQRNHPKHFSMKKHCFQLIPIESDRTPELCKTCPLFKAHQKMVKKSMYTQ